MRIVLFMNNWGGWQVAKWLRKQQNEIVGLVVQPESNQRFAAEICEAVNLPADQIWRASELGGRHFLDAIRSAKPQIGVSAWFGYVLKPELLELFSHGCVNLHAAYLPWNRGWHTNVWPILDGSPAGVTVHYIDQGVDTGDLIAQACVPVTATDTGGSLHRKLTLALISLFESIWPAIIGGTNRRTPQNHALATSHRRRDLAELDEIDRARTYQARDLLNLLRARTYPPYPAAYDIESGERRYLRVALSEDRAATSGAGGVEIDLNGNYAAGHLIDLLLDRDGHDPWPAWFANAVSCIRVRAEVVGEQAIDTSADPPWISASHTAAGTPACAIYEL
ncbi:hypothetical protein G3545_14970 [Starkeya sp. ORNL1]|uniref:methionyl-tRNA formyltransferase n=1 Tax=Starkeya sp. ORNL1 TaxID=2709380 RepID=UPI00146372E2|nr:formyltransferase family protein [Starkeya sp. ORNL1]QJP14834.1 hypothetical protein G3545_14970 [Starkeya sp. ORNL1]